jgi:phosphatidylinositol 3-kinase
LLWTRETNSGKQNNEKQNNEDDNAALFHSVISTRGTTVMSSLPVSQLFKPCDIRKESICMDVIETMKYILFVDEGLDLPIVAYPIVPTSFQDGLIEMVPESITLCELREKGIDILAFLIEKNEKSSEPASVLRERFLQSCAAYCIITFLLGVCDRHLDNIMLRFDGCLFHIDYGFVLGQDPKPIKTPEMRITREMLAALGGIDSEAYKRFKDLCTLIYNCLRRHVNLFTCMLRLLTESDPVIKENGIIDEEKLMSEIRRRFIPGETQLEANIGLFNRIKDSTSSSLANDILDRFHSIAKVSYSSIPSVSSLSRVWWSSKKEDNSSKEKNNKG